MQGDVADIVALAPLHTAAPVVVGGAAFTVINALTLFTQLEADVAVSV